ncbi:MAG: hypothetical protein PWQ31_1099 [Eubacteriales bacterium]|nr:hypothetical protein [Eubacteriales bacterium]
MPIRTPKHIEDLAVEMAKTTNFGPNALPSLFTSLSPYTIRNILRRYGIKCRKTKTCNGQLRYYVDLSAFKLLQFGQIDTKYIADQHALSTKAYATILRNKLPKYQFTAIDVKTRIRFIAYASRAAVSPPIAAMPVLLLDLVLLHFDYLWRDNSPKNLKLVDKTMAYYCLRLHRDHSVPLRRKYRYFSFTGLPVTATTARA